MIQSNIRLLIMPNRGQKCTHKAIILYVKCSCMSVSVCVCYSISKQLREAYVVTTTEQQSQQRIEANVDSQKQFNDMIIA